MFGSHDLAHKFRRRFTLYIHIANLDKIVKKKKNKKKMNID